MKNKILKTVFGCLFISVTAFAQEPYLPKTTPKTEDSIYDSSEYDQEAEFPGGMRALIQYINENLIHPVKVLRENAAGRTAIRFIVEKDGSISTISVLKGISNCTECDVAAKKVIKDMPKWTPAYKFKRTTTKPVHVVDDTTNTIRVATPADRGSNDVRVKNDEVQRIDEVQKIPVRSYYQFPVSFRLINDVLLPAGYDSLITFIEKNIVLSKEKRLLLENAKIAVKFEMDVSKAVSNVSLIQGIDKCIKCNEEIVRVLKTIPIDLMTTTVSTKKPFIFCTYFDFSKIN